MTPVSKPNRKLPRAASSAMRVVKRLPEPKISVTKLGTILRARANMNRCIPGQIMVSRETTNCQVRTDVGGGSARPAAHPDGPGRSAEEPDEPRVDLVGVRPAQAV